MAAESRPSVSITRADVEALITTALELHGDSPAFAARIRALVDAHQGATSDPEAVKLLVEQLTKHFVTIDEIRPDALRRARPGMRA